jgi:hypothetical protein
MEGAVEAPANGRLAQQDSFKVRGRSEDSLPCDLPKNASGLCSSAQVNDGAIADSKIFHFFHWIIPANEAVAIVYYQQARGSF